MDPSIDALSSLTDESWEWLAGNWATSPQLAMDARLGPAAGGAARIAHGFFLAASSSDDAAGARAVVAAMPPSWPIRWARSAAEIPTLRPLVLLQPYFGRVSGGNRRDLRAALLERVRCGPPSDRLHAFVELDSLDPKALSHDLSANASFELALEHATAIATPDARFGRHLGANARAFETYVVANATGSLAAMRVAALALEMSATAGARPDDNDKAHRGRLTLATKLMAHPDAAIWAPASRAVGRIAAESFVARSVVESWLVGSLPSLRRRALLALCCIPPTSTTATGDPSARVLALVEASDDPWFGAMIGQALPTLVTGHPDVVEWALAKLGAETTGTELTWSLMQGLLRASHLVAPGTFGPIAKKVLERTRVTLANVRSATDAQMLYRTASDAAVLAGETGPASLEHVVASIVHESVTRDRGSAAAKAARFERSCIQAVQRELATSSSAPSPEARARAEITVEDGTRLLARGTLLRVRRSASALAEPFALDVVEAAGNVLANSGQFARERMALRTLASACDGTLDEAPDGLVVGETMAVIARVAHATTTFAKRHGRSVAEVASRWVEAVRRPRDDETLAPLRRLAGYGALVWADATLVLSLAQLDEGLEETHLAWIRERVDAIVSAIASGAVVALEPLMQPFAVGDCALRRMTREMDALHAWAGAQSGVSEPLELLEHRHRLRRLRALAARVSRDPVYALLDGDAAGPETGKFENETPLGPLERIVGAIETRLDGIRVIKQTTNRRLGSYEVVDKLGEGGMGVTWLVRHLSTNRHFVMKTPRDDLADRDQRDMVQGLLAGEARTGSPIHHANLVSVIDADSTGGSRWVVFEYLVGCTLDEYAKAATLSLAEIKYVARQAGAGLRALHEHGFVHLDMKPDNVMLQLDFAPSTLPFRFDPSYHRAIPFSRAVVIDLGISRRRDIAHEHVLGTLYYMPPEQFDIHARLGPAADVYAFAATLFHALTGAPFFHDRSTAHALMCAKQLVAPMDDEATRRLLASEERRRFAPILHAATAILPDQRCSIDALVASIEAL